MYSLLVYNFFLLKPILCLSEWYDVGLLEALLYHLINSWALHTHFQVPLDVKLIKSDMHHTTAITFPVLNSRDYHQGIC